MTPSDTPQQAAAGADPQVRYVDLNAVICPTDRCAPVIGGVLVYRDHDHLSATYSRTTAAYFGSRIAPFVGR